MLRLRLRRSESVLLYTKPRTCVLEAAKSATLSGAQGRTAASQWALHGPAAHPECVAQPGARSLESPPQVARRELWRRQDGALSMRACALVA